LPLLDDVRGYSRVKVKNGGIYKVEEINEEKFLKRQNK
jgi:hypothetical protein